MKSRVATLFVALGLGLALLAQDAFGATAQKSTGGRRTRQISEDVYPSETVQAIGSSGKYSTAGFKDETDCYDLIPDLEVPPVTEHDLVGATHFEFQKYGSMGRMISATSTGTGGYRHVSWMWSGGVFPPGPLGVYAGTKPLAGVWSPPQEVGLGVIMSGYSNQTHFNDGTSVVIYHSSGAVGGRWSSLTVADIPAAYPIYSRTWDLPDDLPEGASGEVGAWPKCEVLYCKDETVYPDPLNYIHIVETEGSAVVGAEKWIGYLRCYVDPSDVMNLKCQTPTTGGQVYNIPANTSFQDEVYGFGSSCDISAIAVTGRGIAGSRVAIPYMPPAVYGTCDYLSDVAYVECMDNADGWIDGTDWWPTVHNITNFGSVGTERAYHDLSACYDYKDSLHIVWVTCGFDPANPGYYDQEVARLYHWSKETGISLIASKIQQGANPSAHNANLSKPSISAKDPVFHPGGDSTYLFVTWTQVDSSDQSNAGDQGNADLFGSGSFDGGYSWGKVLNLTGTHTPGCIAGNCVSEHWPSMATNMLNGDLHIEYVCDRDAGAAINGEGQWTENYVMYMRLPEWELESVPRAEYRIVDPPHWYHPPIKVLPNQTRTIRFMLYNVGNAALTYTVSSDHPCIQVSVPPAQLPPRDSVEINVLLDGTGACNGIFIAGNVILSTDDPDMAMEELRVHAVVADDYYECPRDPETVDTLENGIMKLRVNANCMQEIDDIGTRPDTTFEVFFRGGTIVATTQDGDTLVGRFMGENDWRAGARQKFYSEKCDVDWEPDFWIIYTSDIYIEASHLAPPNHLKWWWWEISKQIKFFKETAPEVYKRLVIKYVSVKRKDQPGWWPDLTPFTDYEDSYIGFAMDLDCPADTIGGQYASNYAGYDAANEIAWQRGFDYTGAHPEYNDYYCGIALVDPGSPGEPIVPYGSFNVRNDQYLYPQGGWGWLDGELYQLASTAGNNIQDPGSAVDRSQVLIAHKIEAGVNPDEGAAFTLVEVIAPNGLAQLQEYVDTARAIVEREAMLGGLPASCGDVNGDFVINVGDVVYLVSYLYKGGPPPMCPIGRGDCSGDNRIDILDVLSLVDHSYVGGRVNCPGFWDYEPLSALPDPLGPDTVSVRFEDTKTTSRGTDLTVTIWGANDEDLRAMVVPLCWTGDAYLDPSKNETVNPLSEYYIFRDYEGEANRLRSLSGWDFFFKSDSSNKRSIIQAYGFGYSYDFLPPGSGLLATLTLTYDQPIDISIDTCLYPPSTHLLFAEPGLNSFTPQFVGASWELTLTPPRDVEATSDTLGVYLSWRNSQAYDALYLYEQTDEIVLLDFFVPGTDSTYAYVPDSPGTYCYFLRGEKDGDLSGYSEPACASYGPDPWQVPSVITWSDSGFAPQDTPVAHPEWYWHVEGKDPDKATGWQFGTPVYWPIGNPTGWGTNLPDPYYENNVCTPPLASANIFVPAVQPPGDTRIIIRHWYRTAYNDLDDRCFVAARKYGVPASEAYLYTDPADAVWGAHPYANGTGSNACGANIPGFCGEESRVVSAFHMPTSFNGNWVQIKFYLGSDGSDNQGQYGQNTHWFLDQVAAVGTGIHRGDCNGDNIVEVSDLTYLKNYLYLHGPPPMPLEENDSTGDVNDDGIVNVADMVYLVNFLYRGGSPPPPP